VIKGKRKKRNTCNVLAVERLRDCECEKQGIWRMAKGLASDTRQSSSSLIQLKLRVHIFRILF
jgi:hypothetical protein